MKKIINVGSTVGPYSPAVEVSADSSLIFVSGQIGIDDSGKLEVSIEKQTKRVVHNLERILKKAGSSLKDIVKINIFLFDIEDFDIVNNIYSEYFKNDVPARSCVCAVLPKNALIEIEAIAIKS